MNEVQAVLQKLDRAQTSVMNPSSQGILCLIGNYFGGQIRTERDYHTNITITRANEQNRCFQIRHCTTLNILFYKLVVIGSNYNYKHKLSRSVSPLL